MATYALTNWTARRTHGAFPTLEVAREATERYVGPDDEWAIWEMVGDIGAGKEVDRGRGPVTAA